MSTFRVTAERTAKWWVLQAVEAPGAITQVARLDQADQIKEAIAFVTGEPEDEIEIVVEPSLPDEVGRYITLIGFLRNGSRAANTEAAHLSRFVAARLAQEMSLRDVGWVLDVSHQRAHQLASEAAVEPDAVLPDVEKFMLTFLSLRAGECEYLDKLPRVDPVTDARCRYIYLERAEEEARTWVTELEVRRQDAARELAELGGSLA